jgi:hypothetical protein
MKVEMSTRKPSPPAPPPSGRSPTPFCTQPSSHSPENRQADKKHPSYPSSPQLPSVLPLPPRPLGAGLSHSSNSVALPPIATLSPASTAPSPAHEAERVSIDRTQSRSASPHTQAAPRGKFMEVMNASEPSVRLATFAPGPGQTASRKTIHSGLFLCHVPVFCPEHVFCSPVMTTSPESSRMP